MKPRHVAICIPCTDKPHMLFMRSVAALYYVAGQNNISLAMVTSNASMGAFQARNQIMHGVEEIEKTGVAIDWLLWLDSDMIFPPHTLMTLLGHQKDIVGATYCRRTHPFDLHGRGLTGKPMEINDGLVEMAALPTGCLLTKRDIFRTWKKPYWRCEPNFERGDHWGEDYFFCIEARARGHKVWLDATLTKEVAHIGEQILTVADSYKGIPEVLNEAAA